VERQQEDIFRSDPFQLNLTTYSAMFHGHGDFCAGLNMASAALKMSFTVQLVFCGVFSKWQPVAFIWLWLPKRKF